MRIDLKKKIMFGSFIMLVMVMAISTLVVSNIITKQNRKASNGQINKSFNIIVDDILNKQEKLMSDSSQMGTLNDMCNRLKFIEENNSMGFSMLEESYEKMALSMYNTGQTSDITLAGLYNSDRKLLIYYIKGNETPRFGFISADNTVREASLNSGQVLDHNAWTEKEKPSEVPIVFDGDMPGHKILNFEIVDNKLSIVSYIPMFADSYNPETEEMEPKQFGTLSAIQPLDELFVTRLSNLVEAKVNIFADEKLICGVFNEYDNLNLESLEGIVKSESLRSQKVILNELDIHDQGFFQGILPIYSDKKHLASVVILISKAISKANAWEMIRLLIFVVLGCIILFIPVIYFLTGTIVNPIRKVVNGLKDVAEGEGDLTKRLHGTSTDEVGDLAKWFNTFMERMQGMIRNITENADNLNENSTDLSNIATQMSSSTEQMSSKSNIVARSTEGMSNNMDSVAAAMEEASTNISMVASAAEQMTSTINEIAQNSEKARSVTGDAVNSAKSTSEMRYQC